MLRVSTTTLDSFRRVLDYDYADEGELIASVKREPVIMPWYVHAGSAWQSLLESEVTPITDIGRIKVGDFYFDSTALRSAHAILGPGVTEVKATKVYQTSHGQATVVAQADHVFGTIITDNKFKASTPDARDYENNLQWRLYCDVHGASCFRYILYDFADQKDGYCELKNIISFKFWPYSELEADCNRWLNLFLGWADSRGLLGYLEREGTGNVAA